MDIELVINELTKESTAPDKETPDWLKSDIRRGINWGLNNAPTIWTPITGEASLPMDDEALCVLARYTFKGELRTTPAEKVGFFKGMFPLNEFQFYTILQPPVK